MYKLTPFLGGCDTWASGTETDIEITAVTTLLNDNGLASELNTSNLDYFFYPPQIMRYHFASVQPGVVNASSDPILGNNGWVAESMYIGNFNAKQHAGDIIYAAVIGRCGDGVIDFDGTGGTANLGEECDTNTFSEAVTAETIKGVQYWYTDNTSSATYTTKYLQCNSSCKVDQFDYTIGCGDGILNKLEEVHEEDDNSFCDDGNTSSLDGCSATCTVEDTYVCSN